jgi:hypothetical protein
MIHACEWRGKNNNEGKIFRQKLILATSEEQGPMNTIFYPQVCCSLDTLSTMDMSL